MNFVCNMGGTDDLQKTHWSGCLLCQAITLSLADCGKYRTYPVMVLGAQAAGATGSGVAVYQLEWVYFNSSTMVQL